MAGLDAALESYFSAALDRPFDLGSADCCLFGADWVHLRTGRDPAAAWRGYRGEAGAARLLLRHGGVIGLARTGFALAGLCKTDAPLLGSVGVLPVLTPSGEPDHAIGIFDGAFWATRSREGLLFGHAEPVAIWEVF